MSGSPSRGGHHDQLTCRRFPSASRSIRHTNSAAMVDAGSTPGPRIGDGVRPDQPAGDRVMNRRQDRAVWPAVEPASLVGIAGFTVRSRRGLLRECLGEAGCGHIEMVARSWPSPPEVAVHGYRIGRAARPDAAGGPRRVTARSPPGREEVSEARRMVESQPVTDPPGASGPQARPIRSVAVGLQCPHSSRARGVPGRRRGFRPAVTGSGSMRFGISPCHHHPR